MKQLDKEHKLRADAWLKNQLINNTEYKNAKRIGIVLSMTHEVDTYPIIETMLSDGKKVFVPNTNYKLKEMNFKQLLSLNRLEKMKKAYYMLMMTLKLRSIRFNCCSWSCF